MIWAPSSGTSLVQTSLSCSTIRNHKTAGRIGLNTDWKEQEWKTANSFVHCKEKYQKPETKEVTEEEPGMSMGQQEGGGTGGMHLDFAAAKLCTTGTAAKIKSQINCHSKTQQGKTDVTSKTNIWMWRVNCTMHKQ